MSKKLKIYIATSLNSRIATEDGGVEWLETIPHPKDEDYGYNKFYETIDTTIMGYSTFDQVSGWDIPWPYIDKKNYVVTRKTDLEPDPNVEFISQNHTEFVKELKESDGKDIWLVGGGKVNTMMLNAGLVDELIIHVMPVVLDGGIELFGGDPALSQLSLVSSKTYDSGVVELHYSIKK